MAGAAAANAIVMRAAAGMLDGGDDSGPGKDASDEGEESRRGQR